MSKFGVHVLPFYYHLLTFAFMFHVQYQHKLMHHMFFSVIIIFHVVTAVSRM